MFLDIKIKFMKITLFKKQYFVHDLNVKVMKVMILILTFPFIYLFILI